MAPIARAQATRSSTAANAGFTLGHGDSCELHGVAIDNAGCDGLARQGDGIVASVAKPSMAVALFSDVPLLSAEGTVPRHMHGFWSRALRPAAEAMRMRWIECGRLAGR